VCAKISVLEWLDMIVTFLHAIQSRSLVKAALENK